MALKKSGRTAPKLKTLEAYLSNPTEPSTATAPIEKIRHPLKQPRRYFAPEKLAQLVQSVKEHGIECAGSATEGEVEYTKAMAIARVKDDLLRSDLLSLAIAENLSLNEIKAHIKELLPQPESTPERILLERLSEISKRLQKSKTWGERKKRQRIARLLDELDKLTKES